MARELNEIKLQITSEFIANTDVIAKYELTPGQTFEQQFSKISLENIIFNVFAFVMWMFEKFIDQNKSEIDTLIDNSKIHTQKWYREKALAFMFGYDLNESDNYDTNGLTDAQINSAKIIANAAPIKMQGYLRMKVVKRVGDELAPLAPAELNAFGAYMNYVSDAGTYVIPTTGPADDLKLQLDVYYNQLILAGDGSRLDGTNLNPVKTAIKDYLKSIRFNGSFVESKLEKELEAVDGVTMVKTVGAWSKYGTYTYESTNNNNVGKVNEIRVADAGYMKLDETNTIINYIPFTDYE